MHGAPSRRRWLWRCALGVFIALHLLALPVRMAGAQQDPAASAVAVTADGGCPFHHHAASAVPAVQVPAKGSGCCAGGECHCVTAHCVLFALWRSPLAEQVPLPAPAGHHTPILLPRAAEPALRPPIA